MPGCERRIGGRGHGIGPYPPSGAARAPRRAPADEAIDLFSKGLIALDRREFAEAADLFRAAIRIRPIEGDASVRRAGMQFVDYVPHYFLARALMGQGDRLGAARELSRYFETVYDG